MLLAIEARFTGVGPGYLVAVLRHGGVLIFKSTLSHFQLLAIFEIHLGYQTVGAAGHNALITDEDSPVRTVIVADGVIGRNQFRVGGAQATVVPYHGHIRLIELCWAEFELGTRRRRTAFGDILRCPVFEEYRSYTTL